MVRTRSLVVLAILALAVAAPVAASAKSCTGTAGVDRTCSLSFTGCWMQAEVTHTGTGWVGMDVFVYGRGGDSFFWDWDFVEGNAVAYQSGYFPNSCNSTTETIVYVTTAPVATWARCPLGACLPPLGEPADSAEEHGQWSVAFD